MRGNLLCSVIKFPVDFDIFLPLSMRCPFVRQPTGHLSLVNTLGMYNKKYEMKKHVMTRKCKWKIYLWEQSNMIVEPKSKMVCDKVFARNVKIKRIPIKHGE
jgi:hypothetical protein